MRPSGFHFRLFGLFPFLILRSLRSTLRTRLFIALVPVSLVVLSLMGYMSYLVSSEFITTALERTTRVHAATVAHAVEKLLEQGKQDLLIAGSIPVTAEEIERYLHDIRTIGGREYQEFGFLPKGNGEAMVFVTHEGTTIRLPPGKAKDIRPNPALFYQHLDSLRPGEIWISDFTEVEYPFPTQSITNAQVSSRVLRLATPRRDDKGETIGFFYLGLRMKTIRNLLSLYNSDQSPVFAFQRNPTMLRYTFFIDTHGWVLFQSNSITHPDKALHTLDVRSRYNGTLGKPGFPDAYRPANEEEEYWQMVESLLAGNKDLIRISERTKDSRFHRPFFLAYAPVRVAAFPGGDPLVIGGIVFEDRSVLINLAGYKHLDVILIIIILSVLVMICAIAIASRGATKGLLELAHSVKNMTMNSRLEEVRLNDRGYEVAILTESINSMIGTIRNQFEEIKTKDEKIESVTLKEPVELKLDQMAHSIDDMFPEFIGSGTAMIQMKQDIVKASQVDVDVLIEGETGTGKQLAAEAVHRLSQRATKPFISINCGELDENLLLDSLFGHVKGAFTDSRTDRQGTFLEADGGTLFLDEIQSASPKVQQALLRALSMRKIKQLGSDKDVDVDVRLITATNVDLKKLIAAGTFREDLYYRLKVVTIQTPALRDQRQIIPPLVLHFLKEGERMAGKSGLSISRGALNALVAYSWPGNIRELKHLIITAAVMAEGNVIQAEQLNLVFPKDLANKPPLRTLEVAPPLSDEENLLVEEACGAANSEPVEPYLASLVNANTLNPRQTAALEHVQRHGSITSTELMRIMGGSISKRTAGYDIQAMVGMGLLSKTGRGPTTRYVLCQQEQKG